MTDISRSVQKNTDNSITFVNAQDVEPILKQNKREANEQWNRTPKDTFGRKIASIPLIIVEKWLKEWGVSYKEFLTNPDIKAKVNARLNDPEYRYLRTDHSRI